MPPRFPLSAAEGESHADAEASWSACRTSAAGRNTSGHVREKDACVRLIRLPAVPDLGEQEHQLLRLVEGEHGEQLGRRVFGGGVVVEIHSLVTRRQTTKARRWMA